MGCRNDLPAPAPATVVSVVAPHPYAISASSRYHLYDHRGVLHFHLRGLHEDPVKTQQGLVETQQKWDEKCVAYGFCSSYLSCLKFVSFKLSSVWSVSYLMEGYWLTNYSTSTSCCVFCLRNTLNHQHPVSGTREKRRPFHGAPARAVGQKLQ